MEQLKSALALQVKNTDASEMARATRAGFLSQEDSKRLLSLSENSNSTAVELAATEGLLSPERLQSLRQGEMSSEDTLGDALVQTGALSSEHLLQYLMWFREACDVDVYEGVASVEALLANQPKSKVLLAIANQFSLAFMRTLQVLVKADGCHNDVNQVASCDYTIYQAFTGDFCGEIHLNLSPALMLRIASKLLMEEALSVNAMVIDAASEFLNVVNGNICVQLSEMGLKVDLEPPRVYIQPQWGERSGTPFDLPGRVGDGRLTVLTMAHSTNPPEICIIDKSPA